jgi:F0F1-type ATP synthase membrane subunit b/b'
MDHNLSAARQRAVIAIASQKQQIVNEANKAIAELDESLSDLAATYAAGANLDGEWTFANDDTGAVVLRRVEKEAEPEPEPEQGVA